MSSRIDVHFFRILADSYHRLLDKSLVPAGMGTSDAATWLYEEAPFGILAHDVAV
ncbi:MEKHLA domain-containing protein, partial [Burkholderia ambifaria]|uniref:MEKHLA domain-containing protein n=1 Tax=Burkholderia ambifaria TaxID=152480 RepID=UPI0005550CFC